eukprot:Skav229841  [mRNA]  locus=scaffold2033:159287:159886:- [translate_table: standard]
MRWPRLLRSFLRLYGLEDLTGKELAQLDQGSQFFLQCLLVFCWHVHYGGYFVFEHPAPPLDDAKASVWTSGLVQVLLRLPGLQLHVVEQWRWGSTGCKPIGLMVWQLPRFLADLYSLQQPDAMKPQTHAIGRNAAGGFHTSSHKEYPAQLCKAMASQLLRDQRGGNLRTPSGAMDDCTPPVLQPGTVRWYSIAPPSGRT